MNQEQIVDGKVIDTLEAKLPGVKEKLNNTSKYSKRRAMASIMGEDRKLYEFIKSLEEKNQSCNHLTYLDELVVSMREYLKIADTEVKTHGEVMTPIWLVEDMLNTLPSDVWSNPNLKWLDPCSGVGTFSSIIVQRLMKGLENVKSFKDPKKRYNHIIHNMIYVCELQHNNMFAFQYIFDRDDTDELNTYCGSFLDEKFDEHMINEWGVEKFDIVVGNPPYQTSEDESKKSVPIWQYFVEKSINILIEDGYMCMIHPDGWRRPEGKFKNIQNLLKNREVLYLEIHDVNDGVKTFNVQTTYDFYCVKNKTNENYITKIKCVDGTYENVNLLNMNFIPNGKFNDFNKLISSNIQDRVVIINDYSYGVNTPREHMSREKTETHIYPCVYSTLKDGTINLFYTNNKNNGHFNIPKVIWSNGGATSPFVDCDGDYALTQHSYAIVDEKENLENIKKALLNPKFLELMSFSDGLTCGNSGRAGSRFNHRVIALFRKDFWKEFIDYGEDYLKSKVENKNILNTYEKLEEKLLTLNEVEDDTKKYYKSFAKGKNIFVYCYFLKGHIHINIKRGDIKQDGSKSKGFFTLNDPKNICVDAEYTIKKNGVNGKYHRIVIDETTDIDYVYSLILQKYYSL